MTERKRRIGLNGGEQWFFLPDDASPEELERRFGEQIWRKFTDFIDARTVLGDMLPNGFQFTWDLLRKVASAPSVQ